MGLLPGELPGCRVFETIHRHSVLAPFWFDFESFEGDRNRYTVLFTFFWRFREGHTPQGREREWLPATVPGSVLDDLRSEVLTFVFDTTPEKLLIPPGH
jgi:hypothetical protein